MKIAHDNEVGIVIGCSSDFVGSKDEPEGSFAEPLLRLGPRVCDRRFFSFAVLSSTYYQITCTCAVIRMRSISPILATDLKDLTVIGLFDFLEWNEAYIVATIRRRLGWSKLSYWNITWWSDCKVHWLKKFLYKEMLDFTKNNELFSGMVREKMITMEEAPTRLREAKKLPKDFLAEFVAELWRKIYQT